MSKFMLFMRGNQDYFARMSETEQQQVIASHIAYSKYLEDKKVFLDGDGFGFESKLIEKTKGQVVVTPSPYTGTTEQVSGYYLIETTSMEEAVEYAKKSPALVHGEKVEVIPIGH
jgi:hypothetical protein